MNGKFVDTTDFDPQNSTFSTSTGSRCREALTFQEFKNWYFNGNGLHTASWQQPADPRTVRRMESRKPESIDVQLQAKLQRSDQADADSDVSAVEISLAEAKDLLPFKFYSSAALASFFFDLATADGMMSHSVFYHAFDKLLKTQRSPRNVPVNENSTDALVAKVYSTYDPSDSGFVDVRDLV